jgi:polyhydroxyalkanoate synthesis regulator phasin
MLLDDVRKALESMIGLTPAKAQELAKRYLEPGAAKDQVAKTAGDLLRVQQRLRDAVKKEVTSQIKSMGAATQDDLDALRKRVRDLERRAGEAHVGPRVILDRRRVVGLILTDADPWVAAPSTPSSCVVGLSGPGRRRRRRFGPAR